MTTPISVYPSNVAVRVTIKEPGRDTTEILEPGAAHRVFYLFGERTIEISEFVPEVKAADIPDA